MAITRTRVLLRAKYGWPRCTVEFNEKIIHTPDGYKQNAPGYISMCYDIPLDAPHSWGGMNIVTLLSDGWMYEIPAHELKPGDAVGDLGAHAIGTDGGTIVIFESWLNNDPSLGVALTWEHTPIVSPGPDRRARPIDFRWHA